MGLSQSKSEDQKAKNKDDDVNNRTDIYEFRCEKMKDSDFKPAIGDLNILAMLLRNRFYEINTSDIFSKNEMNYETVAVAVDTENKVILISANIKERDTILDNQTCEIKDAYGNFGINDRHHKIISEMSGFFGEIGGYKVISVITEEKAMSKEQNAECHAEMQLLSYAKENNIKIARIGISKPACDKCKSELDQEKVEHEHCETGNKNSKHWTNSKNIKTKVELVILPKEEKKSVLSHFKWIYRKNLPQTGKQVNYAVRKHIEFQANFNCIVSSSSLLDLYDTYYRSLWLKLETAFADSGKYSSDRTYMKGVYAKAGLCELSGGWRCASIKASFLTASGYAQIREIGISAGVNLNLATLQINFGILSFTCGVKASTGISIGLDGIDVQILGNGFAIGAKKITFKTSFLDISIDPYAIIGIIFIILYNTDPKDFDPDYRELFEAFKKQIISFFGGKPPPPNPPSIKIETVKKSNLLEDEIELKATVENKLKLNPLENKIEPKLVVEEQLQLSAFHLILTDPKLVIEEKLHAKPLENQIEPQVVLENKPSLIYEYAQGTKDMLYGLWNKITSSSSSKTREELLYYN